MAYFFHQMDYANYFFVKLWLGYLIKYLSIKYSKTSVINIFVSPLFLCPY